MFLPISFRFFILMLATGSLVLAADTAGRKRVALVIDDGPIPAHNAAMLELLAREHVHVTFSHVGQNVVAHPELARNVAEAAHEIVNHSYTHPHLKSLPDAAIEKEVADTSAAIEKATGKAPKWFWPPFLEHDGRIDAAVRRATGLKGFPLKKYHFIISLDWEATTTAEKFSELCTGGIVDGTVILMHEWPEVTLKNLPAVIVALKKQGVTFVTFSELAASK